MQPEVLHRPGGEVGQGDHVALVGRVGDAVVVLVPGEPVAADLDAEVGEVTLARHVDDPQRDRAAPGARDLHGLGGLERADDERDEVGAHRHRLAEAHGDLAGLQLGAADLRAVGDGQQIRLDDEGDVEHGLEVGLVEARERPPAVGDLHLGGGDDPLGAVVGRVGAAVPAAQLVVERAGEVDGDERGADLLGAVDRQPLGRLVERERPGLAVDGDPADVELGGVEHDLLDDVVDGHVDVDGADEDGGVEVGLQGQLVAGGDDARVAGGTGCRRWEQQSRRRRLTVLLRAPFAARLLRSLRIGGGVATRG